jgi:hypothetical protein
MGDPRPHRPSELELSSASLGQNMPWAAEFCGGVGAPGPFQIRLSPPHLLALEPLSVPYASAKADAVENQSFVTGRRHQYGKTRARDRDVPGSEAYTPHFGQHSAESDVVWETRGAADGDGVSLFIFFVFFPADIDKVEKETDRVIFVAVSSLYITNSGRYPLSASSCQQC